MPEDKQINTEQESILKISAREIIQPFNDLIYNSGNILGELT